MMRLVEFVGCDRMALADDCAAESRPQLGLLVTSPMYGYALIGILSLSAMMAPTASAWVAALTHDRSNNWLDASWAVGLAAGQETAYCESPLNQANLKVLII